MIIPCGTKRDADQLYEKLIEMGRRDVARLMRNGKYSVHYDATELVGEDSEMRKDWYRKGAEHAESVAG